MVSNGIIVSPPRPARRQQPPSNGINWYHRILVRPGRGGSNSHPMVSNGILASLPGRARAEATAIQALKQQPSIGIQWYPRILLRPGRGGINSHCPWYPTVSSYPRPARPSRMQQPPNGIQWYPRISATAGAEPAAILWYSMVSTYPRPAGPEVAAIQWYPILSSHLRPSAGRAQARGPRLWRKPATPANGGLRRGPIPAAFPIHPIRTIVHTTPTMKEPHINGHISNGRTNTDAVMLVMMVTRPGRDNTNAQWHCILACIYIYVYMYT